jgi:predicted DCC family thiol-disulfide oxidoreductase YuxK
MAEWTLFYDGGCNLCHASQLRVERWAKRKGQPLRVEILQSPEGVAKGYTDGGMVLEAETVLVGADAWMRIMAVAPFPLSLVYPLSKFAPFRFLMAVGYNLVAKFRYRLFGRRSCPLPTPRETPREEAPAGR